MIDLYGTSTNNHFISVIIIKLDCGFSFHPLPSLVLLVHYSLQCSSKVLISIHYKLDNLISVAFSRLNKDQQSNKYLNDEIEDPATHKEHTKQQLKMHVAHAQNYEVACNAIINPCFTSYAFWHCFFQAAAVSYAKQVVKLMDSLLMAGKATVEMNKELNTQKMRAPLLHKTVIIFTDILLCQHTDLIDGFYILKLLKDDGHNQIN
ncbi:uncharacterized protein LOC114378291 isoform X2 [Glycine soja]|uniref:Uncharacterized protein n=1 Tax=Glycine soja TaxID=3848 RepID=A0A445HSR8_GLYSO|nr:uncharacterized protein LOC114378291 isoform X2 [Glycine soja]RZB76648.1 hypothetical protein D0Y65_034880 [Glycine soja]RZB76649.1 hypothetical protein D0Y65_034880 [Glycine soja]